MILIENFQFPISSNNLWQGHGKFSIAQGTHQTRNPCVYEPLESLDSPVGHKA
jgi:hypothetical protein